MNNEFRISLTIIDFNSDNRYILTMLDTLPPILGEDPLLLDAIERCSRLATANRPCLVVGERGTGKELFAARLHYLSDRWNGPLVKINCAALSDTLLQSELFGHEVGAFTDARHRRAGRFELAHGGTLIMDEIANASVAVQENVLRVIEYGEFERVGGTATLKVDVRIIGSTNTDLPAMVGRGEFRADLLDRLAFDVITIPPLRARALDILPLAETFAKDMSRNQNLQPFPGFSDRAEHLLLAHDWPGNVRELRNVVERSVFLAPQDGTTIDDINLDPFDTPWRPLPPPVGNTLEGPTNPVSPPPDKSFPEAVAGFERGLLKAALQATRHNQKEAAAKLGLGYHQFRRLMQKHALGADKG